MDNFRPAVISSSNVCYLAHFFIDTKEIQTNIFLETFLVYFWLLQKGVMQIFTNFIASVSYNTTLNRTILKIQGVM